MLRAIGGAWRGAREAASISFSSTRHTTGAHLHRVDHYPRVAGMSISLRDQRIESAPFVIGGHKWQLHFFPNYNCGGQATVALVLKGGPWWRPFYDMTDVTAAYEVSVLDGDGNRVFSRAVGPCCFTEWGYPRTVVVGTVEELRLAVMRCGKDDDNGELVIRCDLTVMSIEEESRQVVPSSIS